MGKITIEKCTCGYNTCRDYWLVGAGKFVQGSGFSEEEAQNIADLLNTQAEVKQAEETEHSHASSYSADGS